MSALFADMKAIGRFFLSTRSGPDIGREWSLYRRVGDEPAFPPAASLQLFTDASKPTQLGLFAHGDVENGGLVTNVTLPFVSVWLSYSPAHDWLRDRLAELGRVGALIDGPELVWWWPNGEDHNAGNLVDLADLVLGKAAYSSVALEEREVDVVMPDRTYLWRVRLSRDTWKRPRGRAHSVVRAHCNALEGEQIPFPGRGESDHDIDDASYGLTVNAESVEDAVSQIVADVMETRLERADTDDDDGEDDPEDWVDEPEDDTVDELDNEPADDSLDEE